VLPNRKDCTVQAQLGLVMAQRGHKMRPMPRCSGYEENKRQPVGSTTARHQSMERVHRLVFTAWMPAGTARASPSTTKTESGTATASTTCATRPRASARGRAPARSRLAQVVQAAVVAVSVFMVHSEALGAPVERPGRTDQAVFKLLVLPSEWQLRCSYPQRLGRSRVTLRSPKLGG